MSDRNRFFSMADVYDSMAPLLVPKYDFLQDELLAALTFDEEQPLTVVDLGAGSGRLLERILKKYPSAMCYWIDYSDDFLRVARNRLSAFEGRVTFLQCRIEDGWEQLLDRTPDLIVSSSAIHHLTTGEKQSVYRTCYEILAPGGWFANIDEMKSRDREAYRASLHFWARYVEQRSSSISDDKHIFYQEWCRNFDRWKERNIDGIDRPKTKGDDIHEPYYDQVSWLTEAGFAEATLLMKYHLWCTITGRK